MRQALINQYFSELDRRKKVGDTRRFFRVRFDRLTLAEKRDLRAMAELRPCPPRAIATRGSRCRCSTSS